MSKLVDAADRLAAQLESATIEQVVNAVVEEGWTLAINKVEDTFYIKLVANVGGAIRTKTKSGTDLHSVLQETYKVARAD